MPSTGRVQVCAEIAVSGSLQSGQRRIRSMTRVAHRLREESRRAEGSVKHVLCGERPLCRPWWAGRRGRAGLGRREGAAREGGQRGRPERKAAAAQGAGSVLPGGPEGEAEGPGWTLDSVGSSLRGRGAEGRRLLEQGRLAAATHSKPAWRRWKEGPAPKSLSPPASVSAGTQ